MAVGELQPPEEESLVGKVVSDRYRIIKKLGEGGMGAVYLAEHVFIEKKVALKVLFSEFARKSDLTARFLQEAKSASRIGHENVIDISDFGQSPEGLVYFAMEFLSGEDLGQAVRAHGAMSWHRAKPIVIQICKALGAAHAKGIIHRDMKPENVFLIEKEGRRDFVKLLDFGIAKVQTEGGEEGPKLTRTGMIFGTPEYMAPEQAEGKVCDQRADLYAVGCVINHLVTGQPPFQADNFVGMLTKHLLEAPKPPSVLNPRMGITAEVDALVLRALSKNPDARHQNMAELMAAVEAIPTGEESSLSSNGTRGVTRTPAPGSMTRPLGGAEMPIVATTNRTSNTALVIGDDSPLHERTEFVAPKRRGKGALVMGGVALGLVVAVAWLMFARSSAPPALVRPTPAPAVVRPTPAPTVDPAPAAQAPSAAHQRPSTSGEPTDHNNAGKAGNLAPVPAERPVTGRRRDSASPKYRRIVAPEEPAATTPSPKPKEPGNTPAELKGFPGD